MTKDELQAAYDQAFANDDFMGVVEYLMKLWALEEAERVEQDAT